MLQTPLPRALLLVFLLGVPAVAKAVSLRDIVELTRAGLDDEVIVALIETDRTVYGLDARKLIDLRQEGVSERVLLALLRNGREPGGDASEDEPADPVSAQPVPPQVIVIDHREPAAVVPYYVQFPIFIRDDGRPHRAATVGQPYLADTQGGFGRFINDGYRPASSPASTTPAAFGRFLNDGSRRPERR
jgi:hypothetical protein